MQPLTFVHISDSHVMTDPDRKGSERGPTLPGAEALIREIDALAAPIEFVLHTGDVNHDPECEEEYQLALEMYRQLSVPVHYLPGNHDRSVLAAASICWGARKFPDRHADQEFELAGGVQFLLLDNSVPNEDGGHYGQPCAGAAGLAGTTLCCAGSPVPWWWRCITNPLALVGALAGSLSCCATARRCIEILLLARQRLALRFLRPHP